MKYLSIIIIVLLAIYLISVKIYNKTSGSSNDDLKTNIDNILGEESLTKSNTNLFLWHENKYDEVLNDTISEIVINQELCSTITDYEKAALCYVATLNGNEINWAIDSIEERSFTKSRILASLNLGDECSETHLGFLRYMFRRDSRVAGEIKSFNCATPLDAKLDVQETFDKIVLTSEENNIQVFFKMIVINTKDGKRWEWTETDYFQIEKGKIKLIRKENSREKF
jgi:hypothetical protein